jgi:hypothetical protein
MSQPHQAASLDLRTVALGEFNIDPAVWGPPLWASVHTLALKADTDGANGLVAFKEFLNSLTFLLPCNNCRHEYNKYMSVNPPPEAFDCFGWTVRLHNFVNQRLGKSGTPITESEARQFWTSKACNYSCTTAVADPVGRSGSNTPSNTGLALPLFYILLGAIIVAVLYEIKIKRRYK